MIDTSDLIHTTRTFYTHYPLSRERCLELAETATNERLREFYRKVPMFTWGHRTQTFTVFEHDDGANFFLQLVRDSEGEIVKLANTPTPKERLLFFNPEASHIDYSRHATLSFDGGCDKPNGLASYGWVLSQDNDNVLAVGYGVVGQGRGMTNNVAEYMALINGLEAIRTLEVDYVNICGDSQLVVNQVNGLWQCHARHLLPDITRANRLLSGLTGYNLSWVPRERNDKADRLANYARLNYRQ